MLRVVLWLALAGSACISPVSAAEYPLALPTRDVDIVYDVPVAAGTTARQRLRFSVARRSMRIDPPGGGLYVVIDQSLGRMFTVREADRSVIDMAAPRAWMPGIGGGNLVRRGQDQVIGYPCTNWETTDSESRAVLMCVTEDGVMLRAATVAGATLLTAATLRYTYQDAAVFHVPAEYRRLSPPPVPSAR